MAPRQILSSNSTASENSSKIILIRHGDRFDYANSEWLTSAAENGVPLTDPPLSALGHKQARETAEYLANTFSAGTIDKILVSPYVRTIQTAVPTSQALGLPICIEEGLSEAHATPGILQTPKQRFAYFPEVDPTHTSHLSIVPSPGHFCPKTKNPCESFPHDYIKRIERFISILEEEYLGKTIVLFSHAASVAIVAGLLKCSMNDMKFAPCGVYVLDRKERGQWELTNSGASNGHVSENSPTTYPWGFEEKHFTRVDGMDLDYYVNATGKSNL
jgi:broad specificity phosphatase PhoE